MNKDIFKCFSGQSDFQTHDPSEKMKGEVLSEGAIARSNAAIGSGSYQMINKN